MISNSSANKFIVNLKWNSNLSSKLVINPTTQQLSECTTYNRALKKEYRTAVTKKASQELIRHFSSQNNTENKLFYEQPERQFNISEDMCKISERNESFLLGGGCVSSNEKRKLGVQSTPSTLHHGGEPQKRLTEITHLDEICTTDDILIGFAKERSIDLEGEILPYFSKILKKEKLESSSVKRLLKVLMFCLEFLLLDTRTHLLNFSQIKPQTIDSLKKYVRKLQDFMKQNMEKFPLQMHQHVVSWINLALKLDKTERSFLTTACTDNDCLLFTLDLENSQTVVEKLQSQQQQQSLADSDAEDLVDNYSTLFAQKNQIFHLIAYRRIVQQNFTLCQGNLPTVLDRVLFAQHKSFNRFKSQLAFDAKIYSLLSINLMLSHFREISKEVDFSKTASIYTNVFFFSKSEGIIQACEEEFKLSQNQHSSDESIKIFMAHHQSLRFAASEILQSVSHIISKYLPSTSFYQDQQKYLNNLIKLRHSQEKSLAIKILFSESSNSNGSPNSRGGLTHTQLQ